MNYIKVIIDDPASDGPREWFFEFGVDRWETRKVGVFVDGTYGYADAVTEKGGMWLSETPMPPIEEIKGERSLQAFEIARAEFEEAWHKAIEYWNAR